MRQKAFIRLSFEKDKRGLLVRPARAFVNGTVKNRRHHPVSPPSPLRRHRRFTVIAASPSSPLHRHRRFTVIAASPSHNLRGCHFSNDAAVALPAPKPGKTCRLTICASAAFLTSRQLPWPLQNREKTCRLTICASAAFLTSWQLLCPLQNREKTCRSSRQIN